MKKYQICAIGVALIETEVVITDAFLNTHKIHEGLKVAFIEKIALKQDYISKRQLGLLARPLIKKQCGQYVLKCAEEGL